MKQKFYVMLGDVIASRKIKDKIINTLQEQFYPHSMRFALVFDYIDTAVESQGTRIWWQKPWVFRSKLYQRR